jgi:hypothetical protein
MISRSTLPTLAASWFPWVAPFPEEVTLTRRLKNLDDLQKLVPSPSVPPLSNEDPDGLARLYRLTPRYKMLNQDAVCEYDPQTNTVYVNEYEYDALKTDEAKHAVIRHVHQMPQRR